MDLVIFCLQLLVLFILVPLLILERIKRPKNKESPLPIGEWTELYEDGNKMGIGIRGRIVNKSQLHEELPAFLRPQAD